MTGDYRFEVEGPCERVYAGMRTILGAVRARHGVLAILGNHDEADMALELAEMGARMLINEAVGCPAGSGSSVWTTRIITAATTFPRR